MKKEFNPLTVDKRFIDRLSIVICFFTLSFVLVACQIMDAAPPEPAQVVEPTEVRPSPPVEDTAPEQAEGAEPTSTPFPLPSATALPESSATLEPTLTAIPSAVTFPSADAYAWELVASVPGRPVDIARANDGSGRLFIVDRFLGRFSLEPLPGLLGG